MAQMTQTWTEPCIQINSWRRSLTARQSPSFPAALLLVGAVAGALLASPFLMPEIRGRTFAEIDEMYAAKVPAWKWGLQ